ncbi:MAG: fumarylacetoacetate hydrolase family protein [Armatimonadota bacterium]|nr:fumarylacetoacetate hydrolase family protein [Armatimonadota bacterium]
MPLSDRDVETLAARLAEARERRAPLAPLTEEFLGMTVADGYRIQRAGIVARVRAGERVAGWKVGLTAAATRAEFGIDEPLAGQVLASTIYPTGALIDTGRLIAPGAEAEVAFVLGHDLRGPGVSLVEAYRAVEGAVACLEIVDSRYRDWKFRAPDVVADNGAQAGLVLGSRLVPLRDLDLPLEGLVWEHNGQVVATATAAEVGGTPLTSLVWLANKLAEWGEALPAGTVVASGSISRVLRPRPGESVRATFTRLGTVTARFV